MGSEMCIRDRYRHFASQVFGIPADSMEKKSSERALGKQAVLAFTFWGAPYVLKNSVAISSEGKKIMSKEEVEQIHAVFAATYCILFSWTEDNWKKSCLRGYHISALGRKRKFSHVVLHEEMEKKREYGRDLYIPEYVEYNDEVLTDPELMKRFASEKFKALSSNHPVQTTAGEGFKRAAYSLPLVENLWFLLGLIHDDQTTEAPIHDEEKILNTKPQLMLYAMSEILEFAGAERIALEVEGTAGQCWAKYSKDSFYLKEPTPGYYQEEIGKWRLDYDANGEKYVERVST